jgi:recombination protein RecT
MGKNATAFVTSVLQIVNSNELLKKASSESIYQSAMVAATLNLPLNNNLGFAYIVPYGNKAQFQLGYKGFIQLAQRSGQFKRIAVTHVTEGQITSNNPLTGYEFDWSVKSDTVVGYVAYFQLLNGYEAQLYMTVDELRAHGTKFSQTFKKGFGLWKDDFDSMAKKTVLKLLLSRFAPLSVDMQTAVIADQTTVKNAETLDVEYIDNTQPTSEEVSIDKENERIKSFIESCATKKQLQEGLQGATLNEELQTLVDFKLENLK